MSTSRPGNRVPGRKMCRGAYEKLLQRLAAEGYDLSRPVDLRLHWARHGTNKGVEKKEVKEKKGDGGCGGGGEKGEVAATSPKRNF
ncbi:hypothetical protein Droror1_Dr00014517 [Drosera rotundifolia]